MQSTGYLQDAVAQWIHTLINPTPPSQSSPSSPSTQELHHLLQGDSNSRCSSLEEPWQLKKSSSRRVLATCPFAVVKPDDVTLEDINARLLRRPQRPVRHLAAAVGVHKRRQDMPGLSGKVVVAATRIRTGGRGTITIIKTKD